MTYHCSNIVEQARNRSNTYLASHIMLSLCDHFRPPQELFHKLKCYVVNIYGGGVADCLNCYIYSQNQKQKLLKLETKGGREGGQEHNVNHVTFRLVKQFLTLPRGGVRLPGCETMRRPEQSGCEVRLRESQSGCEKLQSGCQKLCQVARSGCDKLYSGCQKVCQVAKITQGPDGALFRNLRRVSQPDPPSKPQS